MKYVITALIAWNFMWLMAIVYIKIQERNRQYTRQMIENVHTNPQVRNWSRQ